MSVPSFTQKHLPFLASVATGVASLAAFAVPAAHAQTNLVINGSFENGNFTGINEDNAANVTQLLAGGTNLTGWTPVTTTGGVANSDVAWMQNGNPYVGNASDGVRYLDLTGFHDSVPRGGITQTLSLIQGNTYTLSFDLGSYESNSIYRGPVSVQAMVGNLDQIFTFTAPTGSTGQQWGTFSTTFTATSVSTTMTFLGITATGGQYIGLDDVKIIAPVAPSVNSPEPGSIALLGMGFASFGVIPCRRQRRIARLSL